MPTELRPGTFTRVLARVEKSGQVRTRSALAEIAQAMEREAKNRLRESTHPYGTPTPARPDGPPSLISGNLRRSVTHERITWVGDAWQTKVGTGVGFVPLYRGKRGGVSHGTPANEYGRYLETGLRNGAKYPWLVPAYRQVLAFDARRIWRRHYNLGRW